MDWKYMFSISPEDINDDEKDQLFGMVVWFDSDSENPTLEQSKVLLKISQELLKYKGEQVETLVHELDEIAIRQGEEEAKKSSDSPTDLGSASRFGKSNTIEFENLEQRYNELRSKYKKQQSQNEQYAREINMFKKQIKSLEHEKSQLEQELQTSKRDGSDSSDISETIKDQHRELVETVHGKNKQISSLLHDIEEIERENVILQEKMAKMRDELSFATSEIQSQMEKIKASEFELREANDTSKKLSVENEMLQEELSEITKQKFQMEANFGEFTEEVDKRIETWQKILDDKDSQIKELKMRSTEMSGHSSPSTSLDEGQPHIAALQKIVAERDLQIIDLQNKLQDAIKEMETSTELIETLKKEKEELVKKNTELNHMRKEFKKQSTLAHERCQMMQEEVTVAEKKAEDTNEQLRNIMVKLKEDGRLNEAEILEEMQELNALNRINDKQFRNLVKNINKIQENCDDLAKENSFLRDKMGISDDEELPFKNHQPKHKQYKKDIVKLKRKLLKFEEENIALRTELKNLNKTTFMLQDSIEKETAVEEPQRERKSKEKKSSIGEKLGEADLSLSIGEVFPSGKLGWKEKRMFEEEIKALSEENEALRKGMHEILNSLNAKQATSSKEIKSTTLEKLLRALDVKHISGWYHPAMRLQAEVHNIEGVNKELRAQLRLSRTELDELRNEKQELLSKRSSVSSPKHLAESGIQRDIKALNDLNENVNELIERTSTDTRTCDEIAIKMHDFNKDFKALETQLEKLNQQTIEEKRLQEEKIEKLETKITEYDHNVQCLETKIKIFVEDSSIEDPIKKIAELSGENVRATLQLGYLKEERRKLEEKIDSLRNELLKTETETIRKMSLCKNEEDKLKKKMKILEIELETCVDYDQHQKTRKELENLTVKYRKLMADFDRQSENYRTEIMITKSSKEMLQEEKQELKKRLSECLAKLNCQSSNTSVEEKVDNLSKQLSECEINLIAERQRANHINNLYELVKDQLNKSEERVKEYENYAKDVMHKNLILQGRMKDVEDKLCQYVEVELYNRVKEEVKELLSRNSELMERAGKLQEEKQVLETSNNSFGIWSASKEEEFLALKHQIVDLLSNSDDKAVIARISADLVRSRTNEKEWKNKFEILADQLDESREEWTKTQRTFEQEKENFEIREKHLKLKNRIIQDILENQKLQYHGCIPLISEQKFIENLKMMMENNHASFMSLRKAQNIENESLILKEQVEAELRCIIDVRELSGENNEDSPKLHDWLQEKKLIELDLIRFRRQAEFKDVQLKQCNERIELQNEQITELEEALFLSQRDMDIKSLKETIPRRKIKDVTPQESQERSIIFTKSQDVQTEDVPRDISTLSDEAKKCENLKIELMNTKKELESKEEAVQQLRTKLNESEMNVSLFRKQIGDKQAQITFYEKHIMELQHHVRKDETDSQRSQDDSGVGIVTFQNVEDATTPLKATIKALQDKIALKEESILHFQALLKEDRDNHSLAAARMQEELRQLKNSLAEERQKNLESEDPRNETSRSKAAIDQYVKQVHALEKHADDLHTQVTTLESQLASSRQEAVRWRSLANDRLKGIDDMRQSLEEQHKNEISLYKRDSEKWREEVLILKELINKHKNEILQVQPDLQNILQMKDQKIHELSNIVRRIGEDYRRDPMPDESSARTAELESAREKLSKENDVLRKKFETVLQRERSARDEIRDLRGQLLRNKQRPVTSAKIEKSEKSIKEQLQKKVNTLEEEVDRLRDELGQQISVNEAHRVKIGEDFDRWKKQKQFQQTIDKLKAKVKEKEVEIEKLQQSCNGYRSLIERLEREKHCLENRVKALKTNVTVYGFGKTHQNDALLEENSKLSAEIEELRAKLEMQQRHSGGLGAAIMQEKLEAQERKLAIMELTGKGTSDIRAEMERMQSSISNLQKSNLFLEAKNIELKMDLERIHKDVPRFKEQIKHLESYIEVLKTEQLNQVPTTSTTLPHNQSGHETKKISELERTVLVLKRVVEKLQVENKRLSSDKQRPTVERIGSGEKLRREHNRLKEQHCESVRKISELESVLNTTTLRLRAYESEKAGFKDLITLSNELSEVKEQLDQKTVLLEKVKVLLHRAALKEKGLLNEISELKSRMDPQSPRPSTSQVHR